MAGATINLVLGDNSIFKTASDAGLKTKISAVEDAANIIYANLNMQKNVGEIDSFSMEDIVEKLEEKGFKIETRQVGENAIIGITIEPKRVSITENGTESGNNNNNNNLGIRPVVALEGSNLKLEAVGTEGTYKFIEP